MSHTLEMLEMRLAGLSRQVALLTDRVQECERGAAGDRLVLVEWCRLNGVTMAEALGPERNRAIRALRVPLRIPSSSARHWSVTVLAMSRWWQPSVSSSSTGSSRRWPSFCGLILLF